MVIEDLGCFCFLIFTQNRSPTVFKKLRVYDFIREEEGDQAGAVKVLVFFISGNINLCASKGRALCAHERERESANTNASWRTGHSAERSSAPECLEIRGSNNFWLL